MKHTAPITSLLLSTPCTSEEEEVEEEEDGKKRKRSKENENIKEEGLE